MSVDVTAKGTDGLNLLTARSGSDGRYSMSLPAGYYTLTVDTSAGMMTCPQSTVTVVADMVRTADLSCSLPTP